MSSYRRSFSREDPRLNRQASNTSPKAAKNPSDPSHSTSNNGQAGNEGWNAQTANYNHSAALQTAYQSLPYHNTGGHQYPTQTYYTGYQNYSYNPYENYQASQQAAYINPVSGVFLSTHLASFTLTLIPVTSCIFTLKILQKSSNYTECVNIIDMLVLKLIKLIAANALVRKRRSMVI